jgi:acyl-CoA thioesterase
MCRLDTPARRLDTPARYDHAMPPAPSLSTALAAADPLTGSTTVPPSWGQGRATFGGLLLAQALVAARQRLVEPRPLRAVVATFPAPVGPGAVQCTVRELRHGRAVSQLESQLRQGEDLGCVAIATFGGVRASAIAVAPAPPPALPPPRALPSLGGQPLGAEGEPPSGLDLVAAGAPEFTQHFDYRLGFGAPPYSGRDVREMGGWCRFRADPGPLGEEHIAALLDAWPSPAVARMSAPAPAATMTWAFELLAIEPAPSPDGWWLYHAELDAAADGYAHSTARLWSPAGRLAALSRQAVAVFA